MTSQLIATYANGVFTPESPVDLPENSTVKLTLTSVSDVDAQSPPVGSPEAMEAFIQFCRSKPFKTGIGWNGRDELYERY